MPKTALVYPRPVLPYFTVVKDVEEKGTRDVRWWSLHKTRVQLTRSSHNAHRDPWHHYVDAIAIYGQLV